MEGLGFQESIGFLGFKGFTALKRVPVRGPFGPEGETRYFADCRFEVGSGLESC